MKMTQDMLAVIQGINPLQVIQDGQEVIIKPDSLSKSRPYKIKRQGLKLYCTCPAWQSQKKFANTRTCQHLKDTLGEEYEEARIKLRLDEVKPRSSNANRESKSKKRKQDDRDDDDNAPQESDVNASDLSASLKGDDCGSPRKRRKPISNQNKSISAYVPPPGLLLANKWDSEKGPDPKGWWCSEKLDGVRAYFDGVSFKSRNGNIFAVPQELIASLHLPKGVTLDGELFVGRGKFNSTVSIVRSAASPKWPLVSYMLFDMPSFGDLSFEDRMKKMDQFFGPHGSHKNAFVKVVEQTKVKSRDHISEMLNEVEGAGGEGLMLRKPKSRYEGRRSATLLKIKTFSDAEAIIIGYLPGHGKHEGLTGALKCKMASGRTFRVGSGLSDALRAKPPKIGMLITYRYQELTPDGAPRFPTYVGEAVDKDGPTDI